jgi:hypothetical protein
MGDILNAVRGINDKIVERVGAADRMRLEGSKVNNLDIRDTEKTIM